MVTGPFFSRKEAADYLFAKKHNFTKSAVVYCASGCYARQYSDAYEKAKLESHSNGVANNKLKLTPPEGVAT
jgi:hypothetical protein